MPCIGRLSGKRLGWDYSPFTYVPEFYDVHYPEHNDMYLQECIDNLSRKGIVF